MRNDGTSPNGAEDGPTRRSMLQYLGVGCVGAVAGCGSDGASTTSAGERSEDAATTTASTTTTDDPPPGDRGTFIHATASTAGPPNPLRADDAATAARLDKLYDGPGRRLGPETFEPLWFEEWTIDESYEVVEYTLRDGLTYGADYGQVTAEDYLTVLEELVLLDGPEDWYEYPDTERYRVGPDGEFVAYEKTGERSFRAELPVPRPQWLHEDPVIDLIAVPKELVTAYAPAEDREGLDRDPALADGRLATGDHDLGPFRFAEWAEGDRWRFERNHDYYLRDHADEEAWVDDPYYDYGGSPYFGEHRYRELDGTVAVVSALQVGEADAATVPPGDVSRFRDDDEVALWENRFDDTVSWLGLNHRINGWAPIREHRDVRRALANCYDARTVVEEVHDGRGTPLSTLHPSWGPFYPTDGRRYRPEGTVERARELLASGTGPDYGYDGDGTFRGPDGTQVRLRAVGAAGSPAAETAAGYLRRRLEGAGVGLEVEFREWRVLLENYATNSVENVEGVDEEDLPDWAPVGRYNGGPWDRSASREDWDLLFGLGFPTTPYAPWDTVTATMAERGRYNLWGYHQDRVDVARTAEGAATASSRGETRTEMRDLFEFLGRELPLVWTRSGYAATGFGDDVVGFPGEETRVGYEATGYFRDVDPARLLAFENG